MNYYCRVCAKTIRHKSKNIHFKTITHEEYAKIFQINYTNKNPNFFNIDTLFIDYITNHNKKIELHLVRADFKLDSDNVIHAHLVTDFHYNLSPINLERYLLYWPDSFILGGYRFSHIIEMNFKTISDRRNKR